MLERREGTYRLNPQPRHILWLMLLFMFVCGTAQAASNPELRGPLEALWAWTPFILWGQAWEFNGFALNLIDPRRYAACGCGPTPRRGPESRPGPSRRARA